MILLGIIDLWDMTVPMAFNFDYILMGIVFLAIIIIGLIWCRVKTGGIAIALTGITYVLSIVEPLFKSAFLLMIVLAILMFINTLKNKGK